MTLSETLNILNTYRDRLKSQYEKPGWNRWALFGAFASLIWILISLKSENNLETKDSFVLLIILILCENIILQLPPLIKFASKKLKTTYLEVKKELFKQSLGIIFEFIIYFLIIIFSYKFIQFHNSLYDKIYYGFLYFSLFTPIFLLIIGFTNQPLPIGNLKSKQTNNLKNILLIIVFAACLSSICFLIFTIENWNLYSMWKSSFVFFGLFFVLKKMIDTFQRNPLIDEIDYLIDEVTFNKMESEIALKNLKLIINGLELKDVTSRILIEYFNIEKTVREKINYINQIALKIKEETDDIIKTVLWKELNKNTNDFKTKESVILSKFQKKVNIKLGVYSQFTHDTAEMRSTTEELYNSLNALSKEIQTVLNKITIISNVAENAK